MKQSGRNNKASIYTRVSTADQEKNGFGMSSQEKICRDKCKAKGFAVYKLYSEPDVSGTKPALKRPIFGQLMDDARNGKFKYIIFGSLDRFARNLFDARTVWNECDKLGVEIISCREEHLDSSTAVGKYMTNMILGAAEFESDLIK